MVPDAVVIALVTQLVGAAVKVTGGGHAELEVTPEELLLVEPDDELLLPLDDELLELLPDDELELLAAPEELDDDELDEDELDELEEVGSPFEVTGSLPPQAASNAQRPSPTTPNRRGVRNAICNCYW
jgi:hypothetical protein